MNHFLNFGSIDCPYFNLRNRKLELDPVENVGEFDVSLAYQANEDFSTELNVSSVKVPDYLYVKATLRVDPGVEDDYVLQV